MSAWPSALAAKLNDLYPQPAGSRPHPSKSDDITTVALSNLQDWVASILDTVSDLVRPTPQPASLNDKIIHLFTTYSTASVSTVAVLLLSFIFLGYRYMMDRRSFSWDGRASPVFGHHADGRNLSSHFEYIDPDDELYKGHRPSVPVQEYPDINGIDLNTPDRIHVNYRAQIFGVDFPAYSINEERAIVKDLRRKVADRLGFPAAQVRLVYKGKELKRNAHPLKQYRMKQNSEVFAIVTEKHENYDREDHNSPSESGSDSGSNTNSPHLKRQQRPRSYSSVRYRGDEQAPRVQTDSGAFLHPNGHVPSTPVERQHKDSLRPSDRMPRHDSLRPPADGHDYRESARQPERPDSRRERDASRNRDASRSRGTSPAPSSKPIPAADSNTPLGKVQALSSTFHTKWLPQCTKFILSPPRDDEARKKEFLKLSESVMQHVVLKADNIETEGNTDARNGRKTLVNEAYAVLKQLDAVAK